jgi:hypothetical protein
MIDEDALALFVRMEKGPAEERQAFSDGTRQLARKLDLISEWWMGCTPCDRSPGPHMSPGYGAYDGWLRCREVREELLAIARERGLLTARKPPCPPANVG